MISPKGRPPKSPSSDREVDFGDSVLGLGVVGVVLMPGSSYKYWRATVLVGSMSRTRLA